MPRVTAEEFADKHNRRLKASLEDVRTGIQRVTVAPTEQAAKKKDKMKAKLNEAIDNGAWERGLKRVTLSDWQNKFLEKGVNRIPGGIDAAKDKVVDFARQVLPYIDTGQKKIAGMPDMTIEDSVARASEWIRHMSKFKKQ